LKYEELVQLKNEIKKEVKAELKKEKKEKKENEKKDKDQLTTKEEERSIFDTKREPRKAFATFLRNQNKLYVNTVNMIDRKAAIMIRINSTIVSAVVIFFDYIRQIHYGAFIGITMVSFSFISLMLAINASRPNAFSFLKKYLHQIVSKYSKLEERIFTIGFNDSVSLEEYEAAYDKIVNNQKLQIGNQVRAMYLFEKHQRKSIIMMELSYISFIVGFTISVGIFILGITQSSFF